MNNYIIYHSHTMLSNATTNIDSVNSYKQYIDRAKELNMIAFGFSEHGSLLEWLHKKEYCEKNGIKYIHAVEAYVTENFNEKIRDNYHVVLIAKNYDGFKELNTLVSKSFNRSHAKIVDDIDRFYYQPRISYEELKNTSQNIIITTACLGGILGKQNNIHNDFIDFIIQNRNRCFLEIQHHLIEEQKKYNKYLYELSQRYDIKLIAGTDTHALNFEYLDGRKILQKSKKTYFENEEGWDLSFKTYEELVKLYRVQNSMPFNEAIKAIENTNLLYDIVEDFQVDKTYKYPSFSNNPREDVYKLSQKGISERGLKNTRELQERINYEIDTYEHNGASNLLLLEYDVKKFARDNKIYYGDSRGSISGSIIAYLLKITNVNSIKHKLNFERFMNKERVSLADIDTDWNPEQRELVKQYLYNNEKYYCCEIITFNTIALKGAIRDVGRALEIPLSEVDHICKNIEEDETYFREKYKLLFKYVDMLQGVIVSIGSHPAATVCSPITLYDNVGTITLSTNNHPVSCLNMKEIDSLNFVKLDLLGLDNVGIIAKTCELANIDLLTSDNVDDTDDKVWEHIFISPLSIFQYESDYAHNYLKNVFRPDVLEKIKKQNPNVSKIDLMSMANGAIRPAGESYRESLANGEFKNNGHIALNNLLSSTNGFLVYQEQVLEFLHKFCGFTMGEADVVRRGFAKKTGTEIYIPKIKDGFIKTMQSEYGVDQLKAENIIIDFLKVIEDASAYLFSLNHALPYSYIGYICGYLRYYYPLEFLTVVLNINKDNKNKTAKVFEYLTNYTNIKIKPIKFRYSKAEYTPDKDNNVIYQGIASIKYCNEQVAEELFLLRNNSYSNFTDLLVDIKESTSVNNRQIIALIQLNFFIEFGGNKKLLQINELFNNRYNKNHKDDTKQNRIAEILEYEESLQNDSLSVKEQIKAEEEYLGYIKYKTGNKDDRTKLYVVDIQNLNNSKSPSFTLYSIGTGKIGVMKMQKKVYKELEQPVVAGDIIKLKRYIDKPKAIYKGTNGKGKPIFDKHPTEKDFWIESLEIIK